MSPPLASFSFDIPSPLPPTTTTTTSPRNTSKTFKTAISWDENPTLKSFGKAIQTHNIDDAVLLPEGGIETCNAENYDDAEQERFERIVYTEREIVVERVAAVKVVNVDMSYVDGGDGDGDDDVVMDMDDEQGQGQVQDEDEDDNDDDGDEDGNEDDVENYKYDTSVGRPGPWTTEIISLPPPIPFVKKGNLNEVAVRNDDGEDDNEGGEDSWTPSVPSLPQWARGFQSTGTGTDTGDGDGDDESEVISMSNGEETGGG